MLATSGASAPNAFTTTAPVAGMPEIEAMVLQRYGLRGVTEPLTSERDLNVRLFDERNGAEYVVKIANASEDAAVTAFQNRALQQIAAAAPEVPVPTVLPALDGRTEITVELGGQRHVCRVLSYLKGVPLYRTRSSPGQRHALGTCLARLSKALASFDDPAADHEILWDLKHIAQLVPLTAHIPDEERREATRGVFDRFLALAAGGAPLRAQVVHNDFNPHNVLIDPETEQHVTGVLDFGDMVRTPLIYDVAVACSYQLPDEGPPLAYAVDFVTAYHAAYPLLPRELDMLFDLIQARNAMTITITEWRAKRYPENRSYILRNNPRATAALKRLGRVPRDAARDSFHAACRLK